MRRKAPGAIWVHAVSVGEILSAQRLLEGLRARRPLAPIYVSTTTLAGMAVAQERLRGLVDGIFHTPLDYCFAVRRVLRTLQPSVVVILETEIWPNLWRETKRTKAGLIIVNGRISDRAMPRYAALRWFFRQLLTLPDALLVQDGVAAERYLAIGAPAGLVHTAGNLKYDFDPSRVEQPAVIVRFLERLSPAHVWIAASTMPPLEDGDVDEDDAVLEAFGRLAAAFPELLLVLAPRRPEHFRTAAEKLERRGISHVRRSALHGASGLPLPGVLLMDTMGELAGLFPRGDVVFMGGTLAKRGGHNVLEPAHFSRAILCGPHMENFPAIAKEFRAGGGYLEISSAGELAPAVERLLRDPDHRAEVGVRAKELASAQGGATERALERVVALHASAAPLPRRPAPLWWLLWPLSQLWKGGVLLKRSRALARSRSLDTPTVSIGNIGMGGAGKTPCVLHLAACLRRDGLRPAILTRGYKRDSPQKSTILGAGALAPRALTGDEGQLFLRSGEAPVGIGANRYRTGRLLEAKFSPDVILLDDAFQHWSLKRTFDLVLIDALDPWAGGELFPLGRLREPLEALGRADAFLITRAESGAHLDGIEARLAQLNSRAPVFRSSVVPETWVDAATGEICGERAPACSRVAAFCGLANPSAFWQTLAATGCHPAFRWTFDDHHKYRPAELRRLALRARSVGAEVLLTTEKDLMNLPAAFDKLVAPLRLMWLRIRLEIEREDVLLALIREKAGLNVRRAGGGQAPQRPPPNPAGGA